jgi:hypothetical protein
MCVKLVIYKDHTRMHDHQNIKNNIEIFCHGYLKISSSALLSYVCRCLEYETYFSLPVKWSIFLTVWTKIWIFLTDFSIRFQFLVSRKFMKWQPNLFMPTDGRTDLKKIIRVFREFAKRPEKCLMLFSLDFSIIWFCL